MPQLHQHSGMLALLLTILLTGCPAMCQPTAAELEGKQSPFLKSPQTDVPEAIRAYTQRVSSLKLRGYHNAYQDDLQCLGISLYANLTPTIIVI